MAAADADAGADEHPTPDIVERDELMTRLRRAEGQLRGVQRMLEEGSTCRDVLTQLAAVKAALDQVGLRMISDRLRTCVADGGTDCTAQFEEAVATFMRFGSLAR